MVDVPKQFMSSGFNFQSNHLLSSRSQTRPASSLTGPLCTMSYSGFKAPANTVSTQLLSSSLFLYSLSFRLSPSMAKYHSMSSALPQFFIPLFNCPACIFTVHVALLLHAAAGRQSSSVLMDQWHCRLPAVFKSTMFYRSSSGD